MSVAKAPAVKNRLLVPLLCVVLVAITVWTFLPSLDGQFLFADDQPYVVANANVNSGITWPNVITAFTSLGNSNWHPVTWLSHMLDCQIYGLNPKGHHLTNVIIHACNVMLLFLLLRKLTGAMWLSWAAAVLFGIHPLRVQSVAWISERKDVLSLFFWLLTIWAYACFAEETTKRTKKAKYFYGLTLVFFILGLMSKTMLVTMPFVLLLLDYWPLKRWQQNNQRNLIKEKLPMFIPVILVSILSYKAQQLGGMTEEMAGLALPYRLENAVVSYARYLGKVFWPVNLCLCYPHPGKWPAMAVMGAVILVLSVSALAFLGRRRVPYLFVGWFWYLGTLVPVIGLVQLGSQSMADRYTYIPIIGIMVVLVWGAYELTKRWKQQAVVLSSTLAVLTIACILRTRDEIPYWKDDITVWTRAIAVTKDNYIAHDKLGVILWSSRLQPLQEQAQIEFEEAVRINPDFAPSQKSLGGVLFKLQHYTEALDHYKKGLELAPEDSYHWNYCARCSYILGRLNDALVYYRKSLAIGDDPSVPQKINEILQRQALAKQQNTGLRAVLEKDPDRVEALNNLAWFLATSLSEDERNGNEAIQLATRACELSHNYPVCVSTLAAAYAEAGQYDKALASAEMACSLAEQSTDQRPLKGCLATRECIREHLPCYEMSVYNNLPQSPK